MRSTRRLVLSCAPCLLLFLISALRPAAAETVTDFYYSVAEDGTLVQESGPPDVKPRLGTPVILYAANDSDIPIPDNGTEVISEIIMPPEHQSIPFKTSKIHFRIVHPVTSDIYAVIQDVVVWNREAQSYPNPERTYDHVTTYGDKWIRPILRVRDYKPGNTGYIDLFEVWFEHVDDITGPTNPGNPRIVAPDDHGMRDNDNITNIDRPEFIWYPSTDNMSGVDAYFISYTDNTPDGVGVGDYIIGAIGDKQPPPPPSWKLKPTDPPIPQGVHQLAIRAIDGAGNLGGVTLLAFEIDLTAPAVPILLEPADRAVIGTPQPLLKWSDVGPVWKYEIALRDPLLIGSLAGESGVPQWQVHPPLAYLGWTWKVRAFDVAGNVGTFSPERLVTIAAQPPPPPTAVRILPADDTGTSSSDAITSKDRPRFDWAAPDVPAGVHTYEVSIDDGAARQIGANVPGWQPPPGEAFAEGTRQVRFRAVEGSTERLPGAWSAPYFFTIDRTPPPPPALLAPAAAAELEDSTPLLDWSDVPGAGKYRVRVTDQRTPEDARLAEATASAWEVTPALPLRQWFWQVQAIDIAGNEGAFAPALAFVMTAPPPPPPTNVRLTLADDTGISDSDGLTNVARPALRWSAPIVPSGIAGWEIELDGAPRELTGTLAQWGLPATEPALAEGAHTFRVRTIEGSDRRKRGDWTSHFCFTVDRTPPPAPGLYAPAAGAVFGGKSPLFTWQSLAGIWKCQVVLQPDLPSSDTERRSDERVHANWTPLAPLARGMWRWQIRAWDIAGNAGAFDLSPTGPWSRFEVRPPATLVASLRDGDDLATPSQVLMALGPIRMVSGHNPATIEGVTPLEPQRLEAWRLGPRGYELWHETTLTLQPEQRQELSLLRALPRAIESGIESTGPASALATARLYTGTWYFSPEVYTGPPVRLRVWVDRDGNEPYDACADSPFQLFPYNKKLQVQFPVDSIPAGAHQWCYELETQLGNGRVVRTDASDWRPAFTVPLRAGVEGRFEPSHAVIGRGGAPVFELPLRNTGNTTDSLTLTPLLPAGWSADLSAAAMTLAPGESWRTVARLTPPAAVAPGRHVVRCRVHSAAAGGVVAEIETEVIVTAAAAATLEGIVLDALTGAPLAGAQVAADASPAVATAATGRFTLPALDPLASAATFTRAGYFEARRPLRLEAGSTASLVVLMQPLGQATTRPILAEIRGSDFGPETPAFFIDGAPRTGTVEVLIDWGVKNPGHVRWITPRHTFTDPILGNVASRTFDFGADFGPHGRLRVVPIGSDNSEGDPLFANFQVIPPPPLGGILPGSRFHPVLAGGVLQYRLADRVGFHRALATWPASLIDPRVPLLGGRSFSLFAGGGVASGVYTTEGVAEARSLTGAALDLAGTGSGSAGTLDAAPLWNPESGRWQLLTKLSFGNEPRGLTGTQLLGEIGPRLPQDSMRVLPLSGAGIVAPSIAGSLSLADGTVAGGAWSGRLELAPAFDSLIAGRFEGSLVEHWLGGQFTSALDFTPAPQWLDSQLAIGGRSSLVSGSRISAASPAWGWPASTAEYDAITSTTRRADSIVLSRDYPTSTGAALADPRSTTLLQGVFPHAAPMLARIDAGMLAVWLDDDPALPADARTRLRWSRRTASGWSAPAWLADQAADSDPSLATLEDGSAVCVWARHLPRDGGTFIAIYEPGAGTW